MGGEGVAASAAAERDRLAKEQAGADSLALKNARLRGSLLDAEAVEREWTNILRTVRSAVITLPSRIGAQSPQLTPSDVAKIEREVRTMLTEFGESRGHEVELT
jgi:terminase small subunit / prophage DNA-packing protein